MVAARTLNTTMFGARFTMFYGALWGLRQVAVSDQLLAATRIVHLPAELLFNPSSSGFPHSKAETKFPDY